MSVPRKVLAKTIGIPEAEVRCDRCIYSDRWINNAYLCKFWKGQRTNADCFCSFFSKDEQGN